MYPKQRPFVWPVKPETAITFERVTTIEVLKAVEKIGVRKAPGPDYVPNRSFKLAAEHLPDSFEEVCKACLVEGIFPSIWKK